jgi:hypothetical protein
LGCGHDGAQQNDKNKCAQALQPRFLSHGPEDPPAQGIESLKTAM